MIYAFYQTSLWSGQDNQTAIQANLIRKGWQETVPPSYDSATQHTPRWDNINDEWVVTDKTAEDFPNFAASLLPINAQSYTSYTPVLGDAGKLITMNNAEASTFTIPPNADVAFAVETQILVRQKGEGQVTIVAGSGVTLQSYEGNLKLAGQHAGATLVKEATNTWSVMGNLSA